MTSFKDLLLKYTKKDKTTITDTVAVGLSFIDEAGADLGVLDSAGALGETLGTVSAVLPFASVLAEEGTKVLLKKKTPTAGKQDTVYRLVRNGLSVGAGAVVSGLGAGVVAIPTSCGVRILSEKMRTKLMASNRIEKRIARVKSISAMREKRLMLNLTQNNKIKDDGFLALEKP
ncbi:MAG: hypothetical protein Q4E07_05300 [Eubacteriales bacterium]|nr:hypothetical protein [Eubacteriales bacterium]